MTAPAWCRASSEEEEDDDDEEVGRACPWPQQQQLPGSATRSSSGVWDKTQPWVLCWSRAVLLGSGLSVWALRAQPAGRTRHPPAVTACVPSTGWEGTGTGPARCWGPCEGCTPGTAWTGSGHGHLLGCCMGLGWERAQHSPS